MLTASQFSKELWLGLLCQAVQPYCNVFVLGNCMENCETGS